MANVDSILKSRDIALPTKVCVVKAMVFPVVMYGCESWTIKKAERWRIDAFELCCWTRLLRVPWTARRSNQSVLKEINSKYSKIVRTDFEAVAPVFRPPGGKSQLIGKMPWCWERLRAGETLATKDEMVEWHYWFNEYEFEQSLGDSEGQGSLACYSSWGHKESDVTEWLNNKNKSFVIVFLPRS